MASRAYILFVGDRQPWRIGVPNADGSAQVHSIIEASGLAASCAAACDALVSIGYRGEPVVLAIPSQWCLAASISTDGLPRKQQRQAMAYRLEEKLPLAVEQLTVDFITGKGEVLGVAVETARVAPIIESLEQAGVTVEMIAPTALLALQFEQTAAGDNPGVVLLAEGDRINVIERSPNGVRSWQLLVAEPQSVRRGIRLLALHSSGALNVAAWGLTPAILDELKSCGEVGQVNEVAVPSADAAAIAAARLLTGGAAPVINLRRDALAARDSRRQIRRPLTVALSAAAVFLVASILAMHWRAQQYLDHADASAIEQLETYREVFPSGQAPPNPRLRLASELGALKGRSGEATELPDRPSALTRLHEALARLPTTVRFRILDIRVDGDRVSIDGQARTHGDADTLAAALRQRHGFDVESPRTEQLRDEKGVSFTIIATATKRENVSTTVHGNAGN